MQKREAPSAQLHVLENRKFAQFTRSCHRQRKRFAAPPRNSATIAIPKNRYPSLPLPSRVATANHLVFLTPPHCRRPPVSSPQSHRPHISPSLPHLITREEGDLFFSNTEVGDRPGLAPAMAAATLLVASSPNMAAARWRPCGQWRRWWACHRCARAPMSCR